MRSLSSVGCCRWRPAATTPGSTASPRLAPRPNVALTEQIRAVHDRSRCTYGAPRVHAELRAGGQRVSRKRVARLMREAGLVGRPSRRFRRTTVADPQVQAEDLVQRRFVASAPDQLWFGDITYVRTWEGWLYLAIILDAYSRKVVGWAMAAHLRTELAMAALQMALRTRRPEPGLIQHTDRGSQYTSTAYGELLADYQVRQSVGRPGTCWDKTCVAHYTSFRRSGRFSLGRRGWNLCAPRRGIGPVGGWYRTEPLSS